MPTTVAFLLLSGAGCRRVILENAAVRAAAVPALAKFAARLPSLRPSIRVLIKRSLLDEDDEVGDVCVFDPCLGRDYVAGRVVTIQSPGLLVSVLSVRVCGCIRALRVYRGFADVCSRERLPPVSR